MIVVIPERAKLALAPKGAEAPWLEGGRTVWELTDDFLVIVDAIRYIIPKGYFTDLASIPKPLHWLYSPSYRPAIHAAIFHDRCYSHWYKSHFCDGVWRYGVTKDFADDAFKAIMIDQGASRFTAGIFHLGVTLGGRGGWDKPPLSGAA